MANLSFVVSLITQESDYQREQAHSAQQAARRLNVDAEIFYADNDAIKQSQQLLQVIQNRSSGVNALILEPAGNTAFPQVARAAVTAGLGWVVMNRSDSSISELRPVQLSDLHCDRRPRGNRENPWWTGRRSIAGWRHSSLPARPFRQSGDDVAIGGYERNKTREHRTQLPAKRTVDRGGRLQSGCLLATAFHFPRYRHRRSHRAKRSHCSGCVPSIPGADNG